MLNEKFVEAIKELAVNSMACEVVETPNQRHVIFNGEELFEYDVPRPYGRSSVTDYTSFLDAVSELLGKVGSSQRNIIRVKNDRIVFSVNEHDPHSKAEVEFPIHPTVAFIATLKLTEGPTALIKFNRMLRTELYGCFPDSYLSVFRQVEFSRSSQTTAAKAALRDTMGKSVDNAVRSKEGDIPETVVFDVQPYRNAPCVSVRLQLALEANHESETLSFFPVGDCITSAAEAARADLVNKLAIYFKEEQPNHQILIVSA